MKDDEAGITVRCAPGYGAAKFDELCRDFFSAIRPYERHEFTHGVRVAAVVEGFDKDGLSCVRAFLVLTDGYDSDSAERDIRALCESALPRFKQPRRYYFISELPYTATGKVQRFKLREQLRGDGVARQM